MRDILFAALILGCFVADITSQRGAFEFYDSRGRCWRCLPGSSCIRCPDRLNNPLNAPTTWDRTCPSPSDDVCRQYPSANFPHPDARFFYQCGYNGGAVLVRCGCEELFDMRAQSCVPTDELMSIGCNTMANTDPDPCDTANTIFPTPPPSPMTTTAAGGETQPTTTPETTTTKANGDDTGPTTTPETTTPNGGETPTTTTEVDNTTSAPCVCVVWWPCWCNPCWNMPCHSCNGCVGMMG